MPPGQDPSVVISPCPGVRQNSIRHPRGGRWRPRNGVYSARNHINPPTPTADFHLNSAGSPMTNFNPPRGPKRSSECVECEPPNHCNKRQKPAKRSPEQVDEAAFIEYMETYLRRGFSVKGSHVLSHLKVYRKRVQSPKKPVGKDWDSGFFERYPKAQQWHLPRSGKTTPNDRTIDHDTAALCNILDELAGLVKSKKIPRDKIYFALNTGYMVSGSRGITPAIKRPQRPGDVRREAPSVVYAFSSTGQAIDPYFIFQSNEQTGHAEIKTSQGRQLWAYYSETEWADDSSLMDWFFRVFHPQTKGSGNDNANFLNRIIVLEEERFPVTKELYASCWAKNVYLISIPRTTPGRIILKVFEDLMQGSRFGEPYDTFAKKNMKRDDKMFSVSNEKLIDFIYGQTRQPDLGTFVREAWRESYLMPTRSKDFLQFVEMRKPTPRHPRATPLLQNPRNISAQHAISPTSDMSTPTIVPARNRGRSPPPG
ncbi:hypothetical protein N7470_004048 [Penicillium chermesinum]|nr:hypothetical protein N7470_004048 [Penicillium chermesinum]